MKIVVDMNLSPEWVRVIADCGYSAVHWSHVGAPSATDSEIMRWARENGYVVFTHDLDYSSLLYATNAAAPSVIQFRSEDVRPDFLREMLIDALQLSEEALRLGALVTIDPRRTRISLLPLRGAHRTENE